jgi:hypothetical protein
MKFGWPLMEQYSVFDSSKVGGEYMHIHLCTHPVSHRHSLVLSEAAFLLVRKERREANGIWFFAL